jgi:hypothetical protein
LNQLTPNYHETVCSHIFPDDYPAGYHYGDLHDVKVEKAFPVLFNFYTCYILKADQTLCVATHKNSRAIGQFYQDFRPVSDQELIKLLRSNE